MVRALASVVFFVMASSPSYWERVLLHWGGGDGTVSGGFGETVMTVAPSDGCTFPATFPCAF